MLCNSLVNWGLFLQFCFGIFVFPLLTISVVIPENECPEYFRYIQHNGIFHGLISIRNQDNVILELELTRRERFAAELELYNPESRTDEDIRQGTPLMYLVLFPNVLNVLPKVRRLTVNGEVLCEGEEYTGARYTLNLWNSISRSRVDRPSPRFQQQGPQFREYQRQAQPPRTTEPLYTQYQERSGPTPRPTQPAVRTAVPRPASTEQSVKRSCGRRTMSITPFIHRGTDLSPGEMPWLTAVYRKTPNAGIEFLCGGTLVSARTAITAAHCFRIPHLTKDDIVLHIGRHNLKDFGSPFTVRELENVIIHADYNASRMADADIAIMHFTEPVDFNELINPICLWSGPNEVAQIVGEKGFVAGWGTDENGISVTNIPKLVNADIVDEDTCVRHKEGFLSLVTARTLCAGNLDGSGPCSGDSGGGLMMQRDGRWLLRGIVSAGNTVDGMCNLKTYVLYCDLAKHMTWVQQNVIY